MNEINLDEMDREQLKEQAGVLDINFPQNITDEKLREKIRETLGHVQPVATTVQGGTAVVNEKAKKRYRIKIHKDGKDKQPVPLSCNGKVVRVKRGHEVIISEGHFHSLNNAVQTIYSWDEETNEKVPEEVHSYPFTVLEILEE